MERLLVVGLVMLAGCDTVFGLTRDDDPPRDATGGDAIDAPDDGDAANANPCAGRSPAPEFCFDFDETSFVGYQRDTRFPITLPSSGVSAVRRPPAYSGPNALWLHVDEQGTAVVAKSNDTASFHRLEVQLAMRAATTVTRSQAVTVLVIAMKDTVASCSGELVMDVATLALTYKVACGNDEQATAAGMLDGTWQRVTVSFDRNTGLGSVAVGEGTAAHLQLFGVQGTAPPSIAFGLANAETAGVTVAFDDITVTGE